MNIFYVHNDPYIAATHLADKHVCKMIVESAQMLSTAHHLNNSTAPYKPTHINHPSNIWVRSSKAHYYWLFDHTIGLLIEYHYRYNKIHKTSTIMAQLHNDPQLPDNGFIDPPQCMPDQYKGDSTIEAYRNFYIHDKIHLKGLKWTKAAQPPQWVANNLLKNN